MIDATALDGTPTDRTPLDGTAIDGTPMARARAAFDAGDLASARAWLDRPGADGAAPIAAGPGDGIGAGRMPVDATPVQITPVDRTTENIRAVDVTLVEVVTVEVAPIGVMPVEVIAVEVVPVDAMPVAGVRAEVMRANPVRDDARAGRPASGDAPVGGIAPAGAASDGVAPAGVAPADNSLRSSAYARHALHAEICKYLGDWPAARRHALRALAIADADADVDVGADASCGAGIDIDADADADADNDTNACTRADAGTETPDTDPARTALRWTLAVAATALGDWAQARRQWAACGVDLPPGEGAIDGNFGVAGVRLHAWGDAETVFARRIDPLRACLIGVPSPDSGYCYGDIVLHDGVPAGEVHFHQSRVPVLNVLQRLHASHYRSFAVYITCPRAEDLDALLAARAPGVVFAEDWTGRDAGGPCLRCRHRVPHRHLAEDTQAGRAAFGRLASDHWRLARDLGIAAQSAHSVTRLLDHWKAGGNGRRVDAVEARDAAPVAPSAGAGAWWRPPLA